MSPKKTRQDGGGSGEAGRRNIGMGQVTVAGEYDGSYKGGGIGPSANIGMKGKYYPGLLSRKPVTRMGMLYPLT